MRRKQPPSGVQARRSREDGAARNGSATRLNPGAPAEPGQAASDRGRGAQHFAFGSGPSDANADQAGAARLPPRSRWQQWSSWARARRGTTLLAVAGLAAAAIVAALGIIVGPRPVRLEAVVTVREGWTIFDIARELERAGVCSADDFVAAAMDPALVRSLGVPASDAEGFLFPATYRLAVPTPAARVAAMMIRTWNGRAGRWLEERAALVEKVGRKFGRDGRLVLVTIASMVEAEAAVAAERPRIASVIWNRLERLDPRVDRLQVDPTASYGCRRFPHLASCAGYPGRGPPTRAMLADPANPYNTYRHAGLPPGPIGNPGMDSLRAAVEPERTSYLFYVARGDGSGRHEFSRTYEEHRRAMASR